MIDSKGFIITALTPLGEKELKRNAKIPLVAKSILCKKVLSSDPFIIKFFFKKNLKTIFKHNRFHFDIDQLEKGLQDEMECVRDQDYIMEMI